MALPQVPAGYNVPASVSLEDFWSNPSLYRPAASATPGRVGDISPALLDQTQTSLGTALRGELPQDVQNLLRQSAAEYGVAAGIPGSQFAGYRGLRNLGLTSLNQINRAQDALRSFITTPAQSISLGLQSRSLGLAETEANRKYAMQMANQSAIRQAQNEALRQQQSDAWNAGRTSYWGGSGGGTTYGLQPMLSSGGGYQPVSAPSWQQPTLQTPTWENPYQAFGSGYQWEPSTYVPNESPFSAVPYGAEETATGIGSMDYDYNPESYDWGVQYS